MEAPIVQPPPRGDKPPIPPRIVLVATTPDLKRLRQKRGLMDARGEALYMSRIYQDPLVPTRFGLVGPFLGAPQAAMLLEALSAWGGKEFLFFGWCGAIDPRLQTGDILLPTMAFIDEGTSRGYDVAGEWVDLPTRDLWGEIKGAFEVDGIAVQEGAVWSTDAVFRETPSKVQAYRRRGALAVEMEVSACLSVARLRGVRFAAVLVVSDELSELCWRPGFRDPRFQTACRSVSRMVERLWQTR